MTDPDDTAVVDLSQRLRIAVGRTYRRFRTLRAHGELGEAAMAVLTQLRKSGPQSLTALSDEAGVTPSSMSQTVNRLAEVGTVVRSPDPSDGRRVLFHLTAHGRRLENESVARSRAWFDDELARLDPEERAALSRAADILRRIAEAPFPSEAPQD